MPYPDPPSYLLPHPICQGHPSGPALITLSHALNLYWPSASHMITYLPQCQSLKPSHPRLLPQSPKDHSIHLCLLMRVKEESGRAGWKLNIKKTKIMVSDPITSWQIEREKVEVTDYLLLGSKITVDGNCRHEIRKWLLLGRKAKKNLDSVLKSRDITLPTKVCYNQDYGLPSSPIWLWELDSKEGRKPTK